MNIKNRQHVLAVVAIVAVALLAGDKFVIAPLTQSWKARTDRIAELRKSVSQGAQLIARDQLIRSRWEHMKTNMLPSNPSVAENEVLRAFERWSQDSRI